MNWKVCIIFSLYSLIFAGAFSIPMRSSGLICASHQMKMSILQSPQNYAGTSTMCLMSAATEEIIHELDQGTREKTISSLFYGGTGILGYAMGLCGSCTMPILSRGWFYSLPMLVLSSYAIARSILPFAHMGNGIDVSDNIFVQNFGAHIFSTTSVPILTSLMLPQLNQVKQRLFFFFSMGLILMGSCSEIIAHFRDAWAFKKGCKALDGSENAILWVGLCGGFSFFAAAFSPSILSLFLAIIPPAFLTYLATTKPWGEVKVLAIITQIFTTIVASTTFMKQFKSAWPLLFFVQSFNIVRNSSRIIATEEQNLHILPSAYGWFSYVFPFALSLHPATQTMNLFTILSSCVLTIIISDIIERRIMDHAVA